MKPYLVVGGIVSSILAAMFAYGCWAWNALNDNPRRMLNLDRPMIRTAPVPAPPPAEPPAEKPKKPDKPEKELEWMPKV